MNFPSSHRIIQLEVPPLSHMHQTAECTVKVTQVGARVRPSAWCVVNCFTNQKSHKILMTSYFSSSEARAVLWRSSTALQYIRMSDAHSFYVKRCVAVKATYSKRANFSLLLRRFIHLLLFSIYPPATSNQMIANHVGESKNRPVVATRAEMFDLIRHRADNASMSH